jgi:hypothetical protein
MFSFKSIDPGAFNLSLIGSTCTALPSALVNNTPSSNTGGATM